MSLAWLTYNGHRAGLMRWEALHLPVGQVLDQIACWQISTGLAEEAGEAGRRADRPKTDQENFWGN